MIILKILLYYITVIRYT